MKITLSDGNIFDVTNEQKKLSDEVKSLFKSMYDYNFNLLATEHTGLYDKLGELRASPKSIIWVTELPDDSHWDDPKYYDIDPEGMVSELDEYVTRYFDRELNDEMAEYYDTHKDADDSYYHMLLEEKYYPKALEMLKEHYDEFEMEFDEQKVRQRREIQRRRFILPEPFTFLRDLNYWQQFYIVPEARNIQRGTSSGSHTRFVHSIYALAFSMLERPIATYFLVYNRHNQTKYLGKTEEFCAMDIGIGSNYHLNHKKIERITQNVLKARLEDPFA